MLAMRVCVCCLFDLWCLCSSYTFLQALMVLLLVWAVAGEFGWSEVRKALQEYVRAFRERTEALQKEDKGWGTGIDMELQLEPHLRMDPLARPLKRLPRPFHTKRAV